MSVTYPPEMLPAPDDPDDVAIVVDGKELTPAQAEKLMTTDALIEKMARAFYEAQWDGSWDDAAPVEQAGYRAWMRAAYEAEHEETEG